MKTCIVYFSLFFILLYFAAPVQAQESIVKSLESYAPGEGRVKIHQDSRIEALLGAPANSHSSESGNVKVSGYRVQIYAGGNSRDSRREAERFAEKARSGFPELRVYASFNPPRWLCRVGDFLSIEEADAMMRKLRKEGGFREVTIVRDQVNITL